MTTIKSLCVFNKKNFLSLKSKFIIVFYNFEFYRIDTWGQFHLYFTSSFYSHKSLKCKKIQSSCQSFLRFWDLRMKMWKCEIDPWFLKPCFAKGSRVQTRLDNWLNLLCFLYCHLMSQMTDFVFAIYLSKVKKTQ